MERSWYRCEDAKKKVAYARMCVVEKRRRATNEGPQPHEATAKDAEVAFSMP